MGVIMCLFLCIFQLLHLNFNFSDCQMRRDGAAEIIFELEVGYRILCESTFDLSSNAVSR